MNRLNACIAINWLVAAQLKLTEANPDLISDVVDRTRVKPAEMAAFLSAYRARKSDISEMEFVLRHLIQMELLPEKMADKIRVPPADWGEYTPIMRGLSGLATNLETSRLVELDQAALLNFIEPVLAELTPALAMPIRYFLQTS